MMKMQRRFVPTVLFVSVLSTGLAIGQQRANMGADNGAASQASADFSYTGAFVQGSGGSSGGRVGNSANVTTARTLNSSPFVVRGPSGSSNAFSGRPSIAGGAEDRQSTNAINSAFRAMMQNEAQPGRLGTVIHVGHPSMPLYLGANPAISAPMKPPAPYQPYPTALEPNGKQGYRRSQTPAIHP